MTDESKTDEECLSWLLTYEKELISKEGLDSIIYYVENIYFDCSLALVFHKEIDTILFIKFHNPINLNTDQYKNNFKYNGIIP